MRACLPGLLIILLLPSVALADRQNAAEQYRKGMAEYVLHNYDRAIAAFEQGFREEQQPAFLYNIGQAHASAGRPAAAVDFYQRYLELSPGATDRAEVEARIAELRREAAKLASPPTKPEPPAVIVSPPPVAAEPPKEAAKPKPRWPLWVGIAAGVVVVGAAATVMGVLLSQPDEYSFGKREY